MSAETETVTVRVDGDVHDGRAIDLTGYPVAARAVARAIRSDPSGRGDAAPDANPDADADVAPATDVAPAADAVRRIRVSCPDARPVHEHAGLVSPSTSVRVRTALAAAARSRGLSAPQDDEIRGLRERLADADDPESPDLTDARQRLAGTASSVERLRERVATLRGRVQAGRDAGRDVRDVESDLADATRRLSERETERVAAREALDRARRRAREARDARERRRRLEDRLGNVERAARSHLVDAVREEFATAVAAAPTGQSGVAVDGRHDDSFAADDPFGADDVTAALAVCRVADLRAPVVLACDRFASPAGAVEWLDAPAFRVSPSD